MAIALTVLLGILGVILGLVLLVLLMVLLIPFHIEAWGWIDPDDLGGGVEARWGWGLGRFTVGGGEPMGMKVLGFRVYSPTERAAKKREKPKKPKKKKKKDKKRPSAFVITRDHGRAFARMFARILGAFRFRVEVDGVIGLDDPGDTAMLFTIIQVVEQRSRLVKLTLRPDYLDPTAVVSVSGQLRIWLAHIVLVALKQLIVSDSRRDNRRALRAVFFPKGG